MLIVLNEWIFHDMWGENGVEKLEQAERFLKAFRESGDLLVIPAPGEHRWRDKVYELLERANWDPRIRSVSRLFRSLIRSDESSVAIPPENTVVLPTELAARLPPEDVYLVEAYLSAGADTLVTTDEGLHGALADFAVVECLLRDDFLAGYHRAAD